jgi:hypothetical protein
MAIMCCVSASSLHLEETRATLRFAASAKLIEMKPTVNEVFDDQALLKKLKIELAETKDALQKLQIRGNVESSKGQSTSAVPVADLLLPIRKRESMRAQTTSPDLLTESESTRGGLGKKKEDSNWIPLQTPILDDSESKHEELPPVSEVWFSMGSAHKKCCGDLAAQLVQAEKRSKYLEEKLDATNDLVGTLVYELERARRNSQRDRVGAFGEQDGMSNESEVSVRRQYFLMKYVIYLGLLFNALGQSDKFLAACIFIWLSQEQLLVI